MPERLTAAVNSSGNDTAAVVDLNRVQARRAGRTTSRWTWMQWGAMAASLLLGILVGRIGLRTDEAAVVARDGQLVASGALADALEQRLSSEEGEQQIGMSFRSADGEYCRTFLNRGELSMAGLACRGESHWRITVLSESSGSRGSNYELAGSALPASVITAVDETIVDEPLTIEEEMAARSERWR